MTNNKTQRKGGMAEDYKTADLASEVALVI